MMVQGIVHCHSTYSYDAKMSLSELRELFVANGVQFACMTEHVDELDPKRAAAFVAECATLSDETFLFIPGFEVPYRRAHILMVGMRNFLGNYASSLEVLRTWSSEASFVVLAHPVRNTFDVEDGLLEQIDALEVWNQQYEGKRVPRVRSLKLYDVLKKMKPSLVATGGIDFHRKEHFSAPLVHLEVDALSEDAIIEKLKAGAFTSVSPQATVYGTLPNVPELISKHRFESHLSVYVIVLGKFVNKVLASLGLSLPKSLKQLVRSRL